MRPMEYSDAVFEAAGLLEPTEWRDNHEYLRGMVELLSRMYGVQGMPAEARHDSIVADIARLMGDDR